MVRENSLPSIFDSTDNTTPEEGQTETMATQAVVSPTPAGQEPNVVLAASAKDKALPEGLTNIGPVGIVLPNKEAQLAGFYAEKAGVLVAQFSQYKFIQKKGEPNAQTINLQNRR